MYRTKLSILLLLTALFSLIGTAFAQDGELHVVEVLDGYEFSLPEGWDYDYNKDDSAYFFNDIYNLNFDFYLPEDFKANDIPAGDLLAATEEVFYTVDEAVTFADVKAEAISFDGLDMVRIDFTDTFEGESYPVVFATTYLEDGTFIYGKLHPTSGGDAIPEDIVENSLTILTSLQPVDAALTVVEPVEGYEFSIPAGWDFDYNEDDQAYFYSGDYSLFFDFYLAADLDEKKIPADDLLGATEAVFWATDEAISFADVEAEATTINDLDVVRVNFTDTLDGESYPVVFVTLYLEDGSLIYGRMYPETGDSDVPQDFVDESVAILSTLTVKD